MSSTRTRRVTLAVAAVAAGAAPVISAATASAATVPQGHASTGAPAAQQSGLGGGLLSSIPVVGTLTNGLQSGLKDPADVANAITPNTGLRPTTHPLIPSNTIDTDGADKPVGELLGGVTRSVNAPAANVAGAVPLSDTLGQTLGTGLPSLERLAGNTASQLSPVQTQQQRSALPTSALPGGQLVDQADSMVPGGSGLGAATRNLPSLSAITQALPTRGLTQSLPISGLLGSTPLGGATNSLGQF
jgi:hypothetical protein